MMPPSTIEQSSLFVDEVVPNPMSSTLQPPMLQQPQVGGGDGGGVVATCEDAAAGCDAADLISPSEWSFERLLEEELMSNNMPPPHVDSSGDPVLHVEPAVPADAVEVEPATVTGDGTATAADPIEYNAMLKRKLEEDLAAIAMWRASSTVHPEGSQGWHAYNGGSGNLAQNNFRDGTGQNHVQNASISSKFPARSSSMDPSPSDDDDMDGEVEILRFRKPDPEKAKKRKESNRESARRSRSRKAAHVKDLEDQVTHLKAENSLLLSRLDALSQKYNASAIDNRILRADMETLRVKVKMAEDTVTRLIGTSTPISFSSLPFVASPSHATHPDHPSLPIIHDNNITNSYVPSASDARANNGYHMPRAAAAPSPLQAEGVVVNGISSNSTTRQMNGIAAAASHCATAAMAELLQERVSAMPSSSAGGEAAQWESSAPSALEYGINDANMEGH